MHPALKSILGVILGILTAGLLIGVIEQAGLLIHPLPEGVDTSDREAMIEHAKQAPPAAMGLVVVAWFVGTLVGCWLAAWFAGRAALLHAGIVGALFLLAGVANLVAIPSPVWMWVAGLLAFPLATLLGAAIARRSHARSSATSA